MKKKKTSEFVVSIFAAMVGIAFFNTVLLWQDHAHGVILSTWSEILWAANLACIVQLFGNLLLAFFRPARVYSLIQAILAAVGLLSAVVFLVVFPLDFGQIEKWWLNSFVKVLLIVGIVGSSIAILVHLIRAALGTRYSTS